MDYQREKDERREAFIYWGRRGGAQRKAVCKCVHHETEGQRIRRRSIHLAELSRACTACALGAFQLVELDVELHAVAITRARVAGVCGWEGGMRVCVRVGGEPVYEAFDQEHEHEAA